jgi:hypothetical protein
MPKQPALPEPPRKGSTSQLDAAAVAGSRSDSMRESATHTGAPLVLARAARMVAMRRDSGVSATPEASLSGGASRCRKQPATERVSVR